MNSTVPSKSEMTEALPPIPAKRYFTIGEVSELCGVKPHVLRYWEQEFTQLRPMKRRGNRRYYQHHEVLLVRRIRDLLYEQGFTISGARNRLGEAAQNSRRRDSSPGDILPDGIELDLQPADTNASDFLAIDQFVDVAALRVDLLAALALLQVDNDRQG
jgi:DNA-binding transcriptional MerR regulator